jgi:hypothetical protein
MSSTMCGLALAVAMLLPAAARAAEAARKIDAGPLTAADFRGQPPENPAGAANTATQLRFSFGYRHQRIGGRATVTVLNVSIDAYVIQDASWNRQPADILLLAHEQGHADIAWIQCLKARLAVRERLKKRRGWMAAASTHEEALAEVSRELSELITTYHEEGLRADAEYDRETQHGLGPRQGEWRRVQAATIEELEAKLAKRR